jgi:N-acetylmuramoyl-L-alanine amidase
VSSRASEDLFLHFVHDGFPAVAEVTAELAKGRSTKPRGGHGGGARGMFMKYPYRLGAVLLGLASMLVAHSSLHCALAEPAGSRLEKPTGSPHGAQRNTGPQPGFRSAPSGLRADSLPSQPKATCNRAAFVVVVDVGHTLDSPGARSARGVGEYEFNLRLASLVAKQLVEAEFGKTILLITEGPSRKGLVQRVERANRAGAHLFLSIHHDSVPNMFLEKWQFDGKEHGFSDRFKGHSIFVSNDNADSRGSLLFGRLLGQQLRTRGLYYTPHYTERVMGHRQRQLVDAEAGVYRYDQLIVLKTTQMPAVLLEAGSIINREEELRMGSPEHQAHISAAVVDAVDKFCALLGPRKPDLARRAGAFSAAKQPVAPQASPTLRLP